MEYGCIAEHLTHSFSKEIHARLAEYRYELRELTPCEVGPFLMQKDFRGINVTIPYKQTVLPFLDDISPVAREIGAVNTIINRNGQLYGDNTDFEGMKHLLAVEKINLKSKKVLVFGTGGTCKTAFAVAKSTGARDVVAVSRLAGAGVVTYEQACARHGDAEVIINTTPVGMFPREDVRPYGIDLSAFPCLESLLDAIYHPLRSELVLAARARGVHAVGGLTMLVVQAAAAAERFLGVPLPEERVADVDREMRLSKENLILIGMPGCGKTTVGERIAAQWGRRLIDTDQTVLALTGLSPATLIEQKGEQAFREVESEAVRMAAQESGVVIATGGGAVLREVNVRRLRRGGRLIFLDRSPDLLSATPDRPLSCDRAALMQRYAERLDVYRAAANAIVPAQGTADEVAMDVMQRFVQLVGEER